MHYYDCGFFVDFPDGVLNFRRDTQAEGIRYIQERHMVSGSAVLLSEFGLEDDFLESEEGPGVSDTSSSTEIVEQFAQEHIKVGSLFMTHQEMSESIDRIIKRPEEGLESEVVIETMNELMLDLEADADKAILRKDTSDTAQLEGLGAHVDDEWGQLIADLSEEGECLYCGNTGRTSESPDACPYCGRIFRNTSAPSELMDNLRQAGIKMPYALGKEDIFDVANATRDYKKAGGLNPQGHTNIWINLLAMTLEKIKNQQLAGGQILIACKPREDMLIYKWAYTAIATALSVGLTSASILNPLLINVEKFSQIELDVLVFELMGWEYEKAFKKLEFICKYRYQRGNPTFIITNMDMKTIESLYPVRSPGGIFNAIVSYPYISGIGRNID